MASLLCRRAALANVHILLAQQGSTELSACSLVCSQLFSTKPTDQMPEARSQAASQGSKQEEHKASLRTSSATSTSSPAVGWLAGPQANKPFKRVEEEWEALTDSASGQVYYRSILTGETTVPGSAKPLTWIEVVDKNTGLIYYWCKQTGETTNLGEPKPGPYGRKGFAEQPEDDADEGEVVTRSGRKKEKGGPSLLLLIKNPLVVGAIGLASVAIGYEMLSR